MATMPHPVDGSERGGLLTDYSLEMTARDIDGLDAAARALPAGAEVSVTFLPNEDFPARVAAAAALRRLGLTPVPHISARRLKSEEELDSFLGQLRQAAAIDHVFVVAGDPPAPEGPYADALAVISSGVLQRHDIRHVGISGYPEGHPAISRETLWKALDDKYAALEAAGLDVSIMTQFGFDAQPILAWLKAARERGIDAPVRVGVAGPAGVKTLLRFAARCGVGASTKVLSKYGISLTRLLGTAGPDPIIAELAEGLDPAVHGDVKLHFYPFGGLARTAEWARDYRAGRS